MSIYFALEYDENGVSRIVQKKDTSTRAITQRDFNLGTYVGNQITSPEDPNQPDEGDTTGDFISQMGTGTMANTDGEDSFSRFIDRSNLRGFMDTGGKDTKFINAIFKALGVPVTAEGLTKFFDSIAKMLPEESEEIKRIRKFYATKGPEGGLDYMDPTSEKYIPGMENYNIVYGNIFKPDSGLQGAFLDRMSTIAGTLSSASYMSRYGLNRGLTSREIQAIIDGTYAGPETPLTKRYKNLNDVAVSEFNFKDDNDKIDTSKLIDPAGGETITGPNIDEEAGRPDDPISDAQRRAEAAAAAAGGDRQRQAMQRAADQARIDAANRQYRDDPASYSGSYDAKDDTSYDDPFDPGGGE